MNLGTLRNIRFLGMCIAAKYTFFILPTRSVNLGGLFVLEPFISPALFEKYQGTVDEWTLSQAMAADAANGGLDQIEEHYKTFIVRSSFSPLQHIDRVLCRPKKTWLKSQVPA